MKDFFGIYGKFRLEWEDISTVLTILNVSFIIMGFWWAPILGIINCGLSVIINLGKQTHINFYIMQIALLVLNIYFLL